MTKRRRTMLRIQRAHLSRGPARPVSRRRFALGGAAMLGLGASSLSLLSTRRRRMAERIPLVRPPSASHDDARFQKLCTRCGLCGTVCENGCIRYHGLDETERGEGTPYLDVRRRSCTLCMRCTQICPTGALTPIADDMESIKEQVDMGKAQVERDLCISYQGRLCGYCHDACPIPGEAIRLAPPALPVIMDGCVGCGRCVEQCPQTPGALSIIRGSHA